MSLWFGNVFIPGTPGPPQIASPELGRRSVYHWGTKGETEIIGGTAGRTITIDIVVHDQIATSADMLSILGSLDDAIGLHDRLIDVNGPVERRLEGCTFISYEPIPLGGQTAPGMLYDVAGCLDGGWWIYLRLTFRQLTPEVWG